MAWESFGVRVCVYERQWEPRASHQTKLAAAWVGGLSDQRRRRFRGKLPFRRLRFIKRR